MKKNIQSALPLGVILGLAAIFFLEYMDRSIKTPEELERVTKFASLGVIPAAGSVGSRGYSYGYGRTTPNLRAEDSPVEPQSGIDLLETIKEAGLPADVLILSASGSKGGFGRFRPAAT